MNDKTPVDVICFSDVETEADLKRLRSRGINEADYLPEEFDDGHTDSEWIIYKTLAAHGREGTTLPQFQKRQRHYEPDVLDSAAIDHQAAQVTLGHDVFSWAMSLSNSGFENLLASWKKDINNEEGTISNEAFAFLNFLNTDYKRIMNSMKKLPKSSAMPFVPEEKIKAATRYFNLRKEKKEQKIEDAVREQMRIEAQREAAEFPFDERIRPFLRSFYESIDQKFAGPHMKPARARAKTSVSGDESVKTKEITAKDAKMYFLLDSLRKKHGHYPVDSIDRYLSDIAGKEGIDFGSEVIGRALKNEYISRVQFQNLDGKGNSYQYMLSTEGQKYLGSHDARIVTQYAIKLADQKANSQELDDLFRRKKPVKAENVSELVQSESAEGEDLVESRATKGMRHLPLMEVHNVYHALEVRTPNSYLEVKSPHGIRYASSIERAHDRRDFSGNRR